MTSGRDDDALTWDGDDDPTLDVGADADASRSTPAPVRPLPAGFTAVGRGADALDDVPEPAPVTGADDTPVAEASVDRAPMGNATLITVGVLGGVYLLYAIGWLIGGLRLQGWRPFLVTDAMYQGSLWLATLAPVLWFATVFLLTRGSAAWVRIVWLIAGVVLLVPWPFVLIGAVGQ